MNIAKMQFSGHRSYFSRNFKTLSGYLWCCVTPHWCKPIVFVKMQKKTNRFKPSSKIFLLTVPRLYFFRGSFVLFMSCVCHAYTSVYCCLVVTSGERADLWILVVFLLRYRGSGVVLYCVGFWSLSPFLLWYCGSVKRGQCSVYLYTTLNECWWEIMTMHHYCVNVAMSLCCGIAYSGALNDLNIRYASSLL